MHSALFVSDIHIESMRDPKAILFLEFLQSLNSSNCSHLFLLGDIFDFWIADHEVFINEYEPLLAELYRLRAEKVEIHYFEGNHDLHLEKFWQGEMGIVVHGGPSYFELHSKALRVEHGDQMDPEDKGYIFLRWFLRTPLMKWLAFHLPSFVVHKLGTSSASASRNYTSEVKTISKDKAREKIHRHAEEVYTHKHFDLMISGHLHVRDTYKLAAGAESWNLGTWLEQPGYLKLDASGVEWLNLGSSNGTKS